MGAGPETRSLSELHRSVAVPAGGSWLRRLFAFAGPAYLVSVGYMDPGNWATDLAGGARFGSRLLWVLLMSNLMAVLLQTLSARLGVVTGKDLAQACRDWYPRALILPLWVLCEIAIVACDLAEVLGAAIGLQLLFGFPLLAGVTVTALDVLLLLGLSRFGMRRLEALIIVLVATIGVCFAIEIVIARPDVADLLRGLLPRGDDGRLELFARASGGGFALLGLHHDVLYVAMGILGATVMPHNLYLHSALVQSRAVVDSEAGKREACRLNLVDSAVALNCAFLINAAILVLAAVAFHDTGHAGVARLEEAHHLLAPLLGTSIASTLFAVALLSSGQSSTITGTLAGQIVMEGFLRIRIRPWLRRMLSRGLAIVPAVVFIVARGERAVDQLLILSQVVLSAQLSFAVVPLVSFTSDRRRMGAFASPWWVSVLAWLTVAVIASLNIVLVVQQFAVWTNPGAHPAGWAVALALAVAAALAVLLSLLLFAPLLERFVPAWTSAPERAPMRSPAPPSSASPLPPAGARRVAVALELGVADPAVIEHVMAMPLPADAELVLLHVVESAAGRYLGPETGDAETREDLATLESLADEFRAAGRVTSVRLGFGSVKPELARLVEETRADLLVTGAHGHRLLGDLVFGSTNSGLRHRVRIPVLTVRAVRPPRAAG
ncbi:MAG: Nramp family divalent metal transporter [Candidatus Eisenbacteria bacterium]|nr:Nramp family divalent metal transporter [Candidatus Eisenbacteria bacterium]